MSRMFFAPLAFLAMAGALAAGPSASIAAPLIGFVDNLDNSVTLQVTPDATLLPGSLGVETAFSLFGSGIMFTGATIADTAIWDTPNPGDNPFIPGSPVAGDAFGIDLSGIAFNEIFAAYGSAEITNPGPTNFLQITYTGSGLIQATGVVGQAGQLFEGLSTMIAVGDSGPDLPEIQFVDNGNGFVTLQIIVSESGSTGSELAFAVDVGGTLSIDDAMVADTALFDVSNPGLNPFTGTVTNGLFTDFTENQVFASIGSGILVPGTYDFLTLEVSGVGTLTAEGLVAQQGQLNDGLSTSITIVPEPTSLAPALAGVAFLLRRRGSTQSFGRLRAPS